MKKTTFRVTILFVALVLMVNASQLAQAADPEPFFSLHYMAPTNNPVRMQYAQLLEQEFPKIGIDAELDLVAWAAIGPRSYLTTVGPYVEGGYDIASIGMSLGTATGHPGDSMLGIYGSGAVPPAGYNIMMWSNESETWNNYRAEEQDNLLREINSEFNLTKGKELIVEWQKIYYDAMAQLIVFVQYEVVPVTTGLYGYDPAFPYPTSSVEDHWLTDEYIGPTDSVVVGVSALGTAFNTILADDVYSQYSAAVIHDGLVGNAASNELLLPEGTDRATWMEEHYPGADFTAVIPRVAESMGEFSPDNMNYTISLRDDVYFHDGHQVDAYDVAFSFRADLTPSIGSSVYSNLEYAFGNDVDDGAGHGNDSFVITDTDSDSHFETITFLFNEPFVPWETDYLGTAILPEHILGSTTPGELQANWQVAPGDWLTHPTNTGEEPMIGCGSLVRYSRDASSGTIVLKKFDGIKYDGSAWVTDTLSHYNAANFEDMPTTYTLVLSSLDSAVAEIKDGDFNILDPQWSMGNVYDELNSHEAITAILTTEVGWQALYFHPEYKGADGVYHLNKKGVRHAISHIVPREDIVEFVLNGLGIPGYTPVPMTSWGVAPPEEMIEYKKTLKATDGSELLADATTAHDKYDVQLALDWMESEGYEVDPFRELAKESSAPGFSILMSTVALLGVAVLLRKRR